MLRILSILLALLVIVPVSVCGAGRLDQKLLIRLDPAQQRLEGHTVMNLTGDHAGWATEFLLSPHAQIDAVTGDDRPLPFTFANGRLRVAPVNTTSTLAISYHARFADPVPQEAVGIEDPSLGVMATIMPEGTFLSPSVAWYPQPVAMKGLFHITIIAPPGIYGVTSGRLLGLESSENGAQTTWQTQLPMSALALAAGPYNVEQQSLGSIQLLVFTRAEDASLASAYLESIREYMQLYQQLFGRYPYAKFAVVENTFPTGYGFPGWTLLGSSVIRLPFIRATSLPHEIVHTWWGNGVEIDYPSGNWGEGLATYVADYYLKEKESPSEAREYRRKILRDYATLVEAEQPLSAFRSRTTKRDQAFGYGKSAMVFHMLRHWIGEEAFWSGLQAVARQGLGKRYGWSDLQRHFEATSATDLSVFFSQWVTRAGAPKLQLVDVSMLPVDDGWQVTGTLRQNDPAYELAVPIRLLTTTRSYDQVLEFTSNQESFEFTAAERPVSLSVDPESTLFRMLYPEEIPGTVNSLRASQQPLIIVADGSEAVLDASRDLLRGLQWHRAPVMSEAEFLEQRPQGKDLLVLGWPDSQELRPELPRGFAVTSRQFEIDGKMYADEEDVLFIVTPGRKRPRVAAYFLPGSLVAARDTARRIAHYGRYSTLVFRQGRNLVKSTWEPANSPLTLSFD